MPNVSHTYYFRFPALLSLCSTKELQRLLNFVPLPGVSVSGPHCVSSALSIFRILDPLMQIRGTASRGMRSIECPFSFTSVLRSTIQRNLCRVTNLYSSSGSTTCKGLSLDLEEGLTATDDRNVGGRSSMMQTNLVWLKTRQATAAVVTNYQHKFTKFRKLILC